jgi:hypothetical protein
VKHLAVIGEVRNSCKISIGNPIGTGHLGDTGIDGRTILKWSFK